LPRLVSWNIRHGGGRQISGICDVLLAASADVVVIGEFRENRCGGALRFTLGRAGLHHQQAASALPTVSSVLVASRDPLLPHPLEAWPEEASFRLVSVFAYGVHVLGAYFPDKPPHIAKTFTI
jgi:hypothetical protein